MRASRFVEPNIARLSRVQTHRKRADNLPASSVQSSSSTRPAQLQAREIQSACGHRLIVAVALCIKTIFLEFLLDQNVIFIVTICRGLTTDSQSVFIS